MNKNTKIRKGFTCGAMDLLHAGHVMMLKECRSQCDYLIVGLQIDPSFDRPQKNRPIQNLEERRIQLEGCKYVNEIVLYETELDLVELLKKIKPDIRFLGEDWKGKSFTGDDLEIEIIFNNRNHTFSSSDLRQRIFEAERQKT